MVKMHKTDYRRCVQATEKICQYAICVMIACYDMVVCCNGAVCHTMAVCSDSDSDSDSDKIYST